VNDPPTAVGGIQMEHDLKFYRKDLNDPPTAVGGIQMEHDLNFIERT